LKPVIAPLAELPCRVIRGESPRISPSISNTAPETA
jgi:hypothetical protein